MPPSDIRKEINKPSAEEDAEERYRKAVTLIQKGRENLARPLLEESLRLFPGHVAARQTLATLLSETGLSVEAEAVLRDGRIASPDNTWFALNLARLQAARGDVEGAVASLQSGIAGRGVNAEYRATLAALLARLKQHAEAAHQYGLALKLQPEQGTWWMGLGLAMAAQGKSAEAHAAYRRSLTAGNLPEKLGEFVRAKLAE
ncbi:MAG: tetratricopeptide repeat protein [Thiobacillus sp.]|nr:tetratricopeptide repeat protein [Thiobacillus sp.]